MVWVVGGKAQHPIFIQVQLGTFNTHIVLCAGKVEEEHNNNNKKQGTCNRDTLVPATWNELHSATSMN